jgi:AAA family ATP:ADP antiporter
MKADTLKKRTCAYQKKKNISILDCFYQVFQSKNLIYLTIIVMGYNLVYNLSDVAFNKRVQLSFGPDNIVESNAFLSTVQMYTGIVSTFFALIVTNLSLHYLGWTFTALLTPVAYFSTGFFFYVSQIEAFVPLLPAIDLFSLYAGGIHMCLTKGSKYSFFDSTKEMAYIGLTQQERTNGKAAIDGIASRLGKSGGSFILLGLFTIFGNDIIKTIPYLFVIIVLMNILWILAIVRFGSHVQKAAALRSLETGASA